MKTVSSPANNSVHSTQISRNAWTEAGESDGWSNELIIIDAELSQKWVRIGKSKGPY